MCSFGEGLFVEFSNCEAEKTANCSQLRNRFNCVAVKRIDRNESKKYEHCTKHGYTTARHDKNLFDLDNKLENITDNLCKLDGFRLVIDLERVGG